MEYRQYIVNDNPSSAWATKDGRLLDFSGNGNDALNVTLPTRGEPIVANDSDGSLTVDSLNSLILPSKVMDPGKEHEAFTVEAWFRPRANDSEIVVLGRGAADGLVYDGEGIHFVTKYSVSGECRASYYPLAEEVFHAVGVHEQNRNLLYVNRQLVASEEITFEQMSDSYVPSAPTGRLFSGLSSSSISRIVVDGLAVYPRPLPANTIFQHYDEGTRTGNTNSLISLLGGTRWTLTDARASVTREISLQSTDDWREGRSSGTVIADDMLQPGLDPDGLSVPGVWLYGTIIDAGIIAGSKIEWDGDGGFTVEVSLDNDDNWEVCNNGEEVPGLTTGTNTYELGIALRIVFPSGMPSDDPQRVRWLKIKTYDSLDIPNDNSTQYLQPLGDATLASDDYLPMEQSSAAGLKITGGRALITPYNVFDTAMETRAVEGWFRVLSRTTAATLLDISNNANAGSRLRWTGTAWEVNLADVYVDGMTGPVDLQSGRYYHMVINFLTPVYSGVNIASNYLGTEKMNLQVSHLSTYRRNLTPAEVRGLYRSYVAVPSARIVEESTLTMTDSDSTPRIYAYDWSVVSG